MFGVTGKPSTHLGVPEVCVPSEQDVDVIRSLFHPVHQRLQLFHPLSCVALTAFKVRSHQAQLVAFKSRLISNKQQKQHLSHSGEIKCDKR